MVGCPKTHTRTTPEKTFTKHLNNTPLKVIHQNIRGLRNKSIELLTSVLPDIPQIICITEHHLNEQEIEFLYIEKYTLGAKYCRHNLKQGRSCIFVHESLTYSNTELHKFGKEQDMEISAIKITSLSALIIIICIYRSPNGNFALFFKNIDTILSQHSKPGTEINLCGDINIDYLNEKCHKREQLDTLLTSYNLISIVRFPTRSVRETSSAIDNIFIDKTHVGNYTLHPLFNGLSDHDGQILQLRNINIPTRLNETKTICNFSVHNIHNFKTNLSYETWDTIFGKHDVNEIFNNFHNTFLRIFHSSFPEKKIQLQIKDKTWITKVIQISIKNKRELYFKM
jgi:exonuclease III